LKNLTIFSNWLRGILPFEALANTMIVKRPLFAEKLGLVAPFGTRVDEHSNTSEVMLSSSGATNIPALRKIFVYGNQLTGSIPSTLGLFGAMQTLELSTNRFTGELPSSSLGNLTALQYFFE
jgi:Leucine-rich repeat (LRR) protein